MYIDYIQRRMQDANGIVLPKYIILGRETEIEILDDPKFLPYLLHNKEGNITLFGLEIIHTNKKEFFAIGY